MKASEIRERLKNSGIDNYFRETEILISLKISCKNVDHYHSIVSRLRAIDSVVDITRGFSQ